MLQIPTHIDKLTTLFMEIGRFAPRYSNLRSLFSKSKDLQTCLIEYHVLAVQLCHKILKLANTQPLKQFFGSFHDVAKGFRTDLERWAGAIRDEVAIQMAIQIRSEGDESSSFRGLLKEYIQRKDAANLRAKFSDFCCQYDHRKAWTRMRKLGSTGFFLQNIEYLKWRDESLSSTLVITGILGSGKSVLLANVIDDLFLTSTKQKSTAIAYFFCEQNDTNSLDASTILGSLARQVITIDAINDADLIRLQSEHFKSTSIGNKEFCSIISMAINGKFNIVFVLDGIDNCSEKTKQELFNRFKEFQEFGRFRLCLACRLVPDAASNLRSHLIRDAVFMSIPKDNPEIPIFAHNELQRLVQTGELVVADENILEEIENQLVAGSGGMFLWVTLQISALCFMESDHDIRQALMCLPKTLNEIYIRLLDLAGVHGVQHRKNLLEILLASFRPLTVAELQEALSVTPGDTKYDQSKIITDVLRILASCRGLVVVDEDDSTVSFVHPTVEQFLLEGSAPLFDSAGCAIRMTERLLTYANYSLYEKRLVKAGEQRLELSSVPLKVLDSVLNSSKLLGMLDTPMSSTMVDLKRIHLIQKAEGERQQSPHPFSSYVADYWCNHLRGFRSEDITILNLLRDALLKQTLELDEGLTRDMTRKDPLIKSIIWKNTDLFTILLAHISLSARNRSYALWVAAVCGSAAILKVMLDHKDDKKFETNWRDPMGHTPLHAACWGNHLLVAKLLHKADRSMLNKIDNNGQTPLMYAAESGALGTLEFLLEQNVDVDVVSKAGENVLTIAEREGHQHLLEFLRKDRRIKKLLIEPSREKSGNRILAWLGSKLYD